MPQAPLPAPAARISAPVFTPINPGTYMNREPMNVLAYMKYPDMIEHALNGVKIGQMIGSFPKEAQANATEMAIGSVTRAKMQAIQTRAKAIMSAPVGTGMSAKG